MKVDDLASVKKFLEALGLEVMGEADVDGEWVEQIIGLKEVQETVVMMRVPGGEAMIELVKFHRPADEEVMPDLKYPQIFPKHLNCNKLST